MSLCKCRFLASPLSSPDPGAGRGPRTSPLMFLSVGTRVEEGGPRTSVELAGEVGLASRPPAGGSEAGARPTCEQTRSFHQREQAANSWCPLSRGCARGPVLSL